MGNRKVSFSQGEYYHIYNRGVEKIDIFLDVSDYNRFLFLIYICNGQKAIDMANQFPEGLTFWSKIDDFDKGESLVDIGVYCLMPNHFHILIRERIEGGISLFMRKLSTSYSMYFNKKYTRTGRFFEGTFKSEHANNDNYLKYLFSYIHLNPIKLIDPRWKENNVSNKIEAREYLSKYKHSSYIDYMGIDRLEGKIINKSKFPEYFEETKDFDDFIRDWVNFK